MRNCMNCGTEVDDNENFCYSCGKRIDNFHYGGGSATRSVSGGIAKPVASVVLSMIGGIIILLEGVVMLLAISAVISSLGAFFLIYFIASGTVIGLAIVISSILLRMMPQHHTAWGILIILLGIGSFFVGFDLLFFNLIFTVLGGSLAIAWKPYKLNTGIRQTENIPSSGAVNNPTLINRSSESAAVNNPTTTNPGSEIEARVEGMATTSIDYLFRLRGGYSDYFLTEEGISEVKLRSKAAVVAISQLGIAGTMINNWLSRKASRGAISLNLSELREEGRVVKEARWDMIDRVYLVERKLKISGGGIRINMRMARNFPKSGSRVTLNRIFYSKVMDRYVTNYEIPTAQNINLQE